MDARPSRNAFPRRCFAVAALWGAQGCGSHQRYLVNPVQSVSGLRLLNSSCWHLWVSSFEQGRRHPQLFLKDWNPKSILISVIIMFFFPTRNDHLFCAGYLHFLCAKPGPSFISSVKQFQLQTRIGVIEGLYIETGWWFGTFCFHILGISSSQPTRKHHSKISLLDPSDWQGSQ